MSELKDILENVQTALNEGQIFFAYNQALEGLKLYPDDIGLREYAALSLLKTGAVEEAKALIAPVLKELEQKDLTEKDIKEQAIQISELAAQIFKQAWMHSRDADDLQQARSFYLKNFAFSQSIVSLTNAASISWLLQDDAQVQEYAQKVIAIAEPKKNKTSQALEAMACLGEAYLLLKDVDLALAMFNRVQQAVGKDYKIVVAILQQLKMLHIGGMGIPKQIFDSLKPPTIVVFTGQMIDRAGQHPQKFFHQMEEDTKEKIKACLDNIHAQIGYCSAACGSDILFIEAMLERGAEVNIVLPFDKEDFIEFNVRHAGPRWESRFAKVLEQANSVRFATEERYLGHNMLYRFSNLVLHGLAEMRGDFLLSPPHLVAVWDSEPDSLEGGAADFIDHWADIRTLHIIDLDQIRSTHINEGTLSHLPSYLQTIRPKKLTSFDLVAKTPRIIKTMLFGDLVGFSKLQEEHIPGFLEFLRTLKATMEKIAPMPLSINTWGDGIFVVMDNASDMAEYALHLSDKIVDISANTRDLPTMDSRISLHSGPIYESIDPFRNQNNFYGGHINRAARLEPVTVAGQVYSTEQFMALLTAEQSSKKVELNQKGLPFLEKFTCEYVGMVSLAKGFGVQPVYHLRWI